MPRGFWILVALLVALSILFIWHYFLYVSTAHFFSINSKSARRLLALLYALLPTGFMASEILERRLHSDPARLLATAFTLWLGVGLALLMAFLAAWTGWGIAQWHNPRPAKIYFGLAAFVFAGAYSAYGVWNARHPRLNEFDVAIRDLPAAWQGRKVVQITDLHLGATLGRSFIESVVSQINAQAPDAVFITGDLFDGMDGELDHLAAPLAGIKAPLGVYYVTGNHEGFMGVERARAAVAKTPVRFLDDEVVLVEGLQIVGLSFARSGFSRDMGSALARLSGFDPKLPSILLYHSPGQEAAVKAAGIRLQLSGHTHYGQLFPINLITRLIYGKYYRGLHMEGDFAIYTSPGTGFWGPMMRVGNHPEITVIRLRSR